LTTEAATLRCFIVASEACMPEKRLSELSLRGRRVLFPSKPELSPRQRGNAATRQRGKYLHTSRDQWQLFGGH
jgi:hypothetical protein